MKEKKFGMRAAAVAIMIALLLTGYAATASAAATTQAQKDFIARVGPLAAADMKKTGILASLTLAQAILESGWGTSDLALYANALFGIKADSRWSGKTYTKVTQEWTGPVVASFRAYNSWEHSVNDHSAFLLAGARYAAVIGEKNYKKACTAIHKAGYATSPDYADKLIRLIEAYGLTAYDNAGTTISQPASTPAPSTPAAGASAPKTVAPNTLILTANQKKLIAALLKTLYKR